MYWARRTRTTGHRRCPCLGKFINSCTGRYLRLFRGLLEARFAPVRSVYGQAGGIGAPRLRLRRSVGAQRPWCCAQPDVRCAARGLECSCAQVAPTVATVGRSWGHYEDWRRAGAACGRLRGRCRGAIHGWHAHIACSLLRVSMAWQHCVPYGMLAKLQVRELFVTNELLQELFQLSNYITRELF